MTIISIPYMKFNYHSIPRINKCYCKYLAGNNLNVVEIREICTLDANIATLYITRYMEI